MINSALKHCKEVKKMTNLISEEVENDIKESKEKTTCNKMNNIIKNSKAQKNIDKIKYEINKTNNQKQHLN